MAEPVELSDEYVYRVAPDGKSVQAAEKLLKSSAYRNPKRSEDGTRLEALCKGSEPRPYAVRVDLTDPNKPRTGCNCMSMKHPCKHALGLMLLAGRSPELFGGTAAGQRKSEKVDVRAATVRKGKVEKRKRPKDTGEALYQAILDDPEDDAPRLIYADWLEENGDPARAEFIRAQMHLARLPKGDPAAKALRGREEELWEVHRDEWIAELPEPLRRTKTAITALTFHRGFLEELRLPSAPLGLHAARLFARFPIYRARLSGTVTANHVSRLVVIPQLTRIRELSLQGVRGFDEPMKTLQILFNTPFFSGVTRLILRSVPITSPLLGLLVASPMLARLRELDLSSTPLGRTGIEALAGSPTAANLRVLSLANSPIGDDEAKVLAGSPHLGSLERLDLSGLDLGSRARAALEERFGDRVSLE
jgi:uncharacterized protein (TIGR02996 family)